MLLMTMTRHERLQQAASWLHAARTAAGLTQDQLAAASGVSKATISGYERCVTACSDDNCRRLARGLGKGEVETRRGMGLYVPEGMPDDPPLARIDVRAAIRAERRLRPRARQHLLNQFEILLDYHPSAEEQQVDAQIDAELEEQAQHLRAVDPKATPRKRRKGDLPS